MNDSRRSTESIAMRDRKILAVGAKEDVLKAAGPNADLVNLGGQTLMPGLINPHGHFMQTAFRLKLVAPDAPPFGTINSMDKLK